MDPPSGVSGVGSSAQLPPRLSPEKHELLLHAGGRERSATVTEVSSGPLDQVSKSWNGDSQPTAKLPTAKVLADANHKNPAFLDTSNRVDTATSLVLPKRPETPSPATPKVSVAVEKAQKLARADRTEAFYKGFIKDFKLYGKYKKNKATIKSGADATKTEQAVTHNKKIARHFKKKIAGVVFVVATLAVITAAAPQLAVGAILVVTVAKSMQKIGAGALKLKECLAAIKTTTDRIEQIKTNFVGVEPNMLQGALKEPLKDLENLKKLKSLIVTKLVINTIVGATSVLMLGFDTPLTLGKFLMDHPSTKALASSLAVTTSTFALILMENTVRSVGDNLTDQLIVSVLNLRINLSNRTKNQMA